MKRHHSSESLATSSVATATNNTWIVSSQTCAGLTYTVTLENVDCPFKCHIKCSVCNICIHMYSCTCTDALVHGSICKHIHLTIQCMKQSNASYSIHQPSSATIQNQVATILKTVQNPPSTHDHLVRQVRSKLSAISASINQLSSKETLLSINKHLSTCLSVIELQRRTPTPANKKLSQQRTFLSTKRKRAPARVRLAKPTSEEKQTIKLLLTAPHSYPLTQATIRKYNLTYV